MKSHTRPNLINPFEIPLLRKSAQMNWWKPLDICIYLTRKHVGRYVCKGISSGPIKLAPTLSDMDLRSFSLSYAI